ncbi:MAG: hypothetical protein KGZ65_01070 [Sphingomonadales bacterium]|nr:hypothetical protein [Sphingomonadaceae bacterium]MBS3929796.1 hypothetical protein [Sphingomonadales bacterium]
MRRRALFALVAIFPAALNLSAPASAALLMPLCTGDGQVRTVEVPGAPKAPSGSDKGCCAMACHSSSNRKRAPRNFEPAQ